MPRYGRHVTTSPQDQAQLTAALDDLTDALEAHLVACTRSTGEVDPAVQAAYTALRTAASRYDDLLFTLLDEVTPWEFAEGPRQDIGDEDAEPTPGIVTVLVRRDYAMDDDNALLAAGRGAFAEQYPDEPEEAASAVVNHPGNALSELLHAYGVDGLDERAELAGLRPRGGTTWVQVLDDEDAATLVDDPFAVADEEMLIYRLDEVFTPDDPMAE
jgi:hypothetical protein